MPTFCHSLWPSLSMQEARLEFLFPRCPFPPATLSLGVPSEKLALEVPLGGSWIAFLIQTLSQRPLRVSQHFHQPAHLAVLLESSTVKGRLGL